MNDDKERNSLFISDLNTNDRILKYKVFHYFYFQLKENKKFKTWLLSILIIIEAFQFISYALSPIHYNSWKLNEKSLLLISDIISCTRISPIIKTLNFNIYSAIIYIVMIFIFLFF